ncbi:MAG TPA: glycosyltransferase [Rhodanobacteraceae bacterium]|jgi:glycosyltransferase involved in cell wall biosynthesis
MRPALQDDGAAGGRDQRLGLRPRCLRILILTDTAILGAGGSERFLRNLLQNLPRDTCEVDVLQLAPPSTAPVATLQAPNVRLLNRPIGAIYGRAGFAALLKVRRMVRAGRYDVVHSQHEKSDLINALLPRGREAPRLLCNRRDMGFQKSARVRWLMRKLDRRFDRIVAPSQAILDALTHAPASRMACIPNGVDTKRFAPVTPGMRTRLREELGCKPGDLVIGCVAGLHPVKRHVDLVDAFARVHSRLPQARLLLVGEGRMRDVIETRIAEFGLRGAVRLLGERRDISRVLPALDLFALASESEGMSNAILEAQSCGLPVVATRVGGNPELVDEHCGVLVASRDPPALALAISELLPDAARRIRLGAAARARVRARHSLQAMANAYLAVYRELADAR